MLKYEAVLKRESEEISMEIAKEENSKLEINDIMNLIHLKKQYKM